MLNKIRDRHVKKILWGLLIIIVPAFVLWGGLSSLKEGHLGSIGTIGGKKITAREFNNYLTKAKVYISLYGQNKERAEYEDLVSLSFDLMVLLWKAKQSNIIVTDAEVINFLKSNLFAQGQFNQVAYTRFLNILSRQYGLGLTTRNFEECVRDFLKIDKLFASNIDIVVSEEEVKNAYSRDTQKAKLDYLFIPDEEFRVDLGITDSDISEFYKLNISTFQKEPKVSIRYLAILKDQITKDNQADIQKAASLNELSEKFSTEIKQAGPLGLRDPIEGIGWKPQVNELFFSLEEGKLSGPMELENEVILFEKIKNFPAEAFPLSEVKEQVIEKIILQRARNDARLYSKEILENITNSRNKDLKSFANGKSILFKETNQFKSGEYIEGIGLNPQVNAVAFSLKENDIHPEPVEIVDGVYVIQLRELSVFDEEEFNKEKDNYSATIRKNKETLERLRLLIKIKEEANLKVL